MEELSFNARFWDTDANANPKPEKEDVWDSLLDMEKLYQIYEVIPKPVYTLIESSAVKRTEVEKTELAKLYEQLFRRHWIPEIHGNPYLYDFHGIIGQFTKTVIQMYMTERNLRVVRLLEPTLRGYVFSKNRVFRFIPPNGHSVMPSEQDVHFYRTVIKLHERMYLANIAKPDLLLADLTHQEFQEVMDYRAKQTQLISRTGKTYKEAKNYFDELLEEHKKLIIVSISLNRSSSNPEENFNRAWLLDKWKKMIQNHRNSRPLSWMLGFMASIRVTQQKGLYLQVYFFFDAEQADPVGLDYAIGALWIRLTDGGYHRVPVASVKPAKAGSVIEISTKSKALIDVMHNRVIPSLTKSRLYVTPTFLPPIPFLLPNVSASRAKEIAEERKAKRLAMLAANNPKNDTFVFFRGQLSKKTVDTESDDMDEFM